MFCTKLKDLNISGECPFSSLAKKSESGDFEDCSSDAADILPISKDVPEKSGEDLPPQRLSRLKVNLHSLGESIQKLANPDVSLKYNDHQLTLINMVLQERVIQRLTKY